MKLDSNILFLIGVKKQVLSSQAFDYHRAEAKR